VDLGYYFMKLSVCQFYIYQGTTILDKINFTIFNFKIDYTTLLKICSILIDKILVIIKIGYILKEL
jgi:hypothetical protein